jgi:hypothetical protein
MNVNFLFHTTNIGTENHKQEHEMPSHMVWPKKHSSAMKLYQFCKTGGCSLNI